MGEVLGTSQTRNLKDTDFIDMVTSNVLRASALQFGKTDSSSYTVCHGDGPLVDSSRKKKINPK
jgi:hypothetical protein